MGDRENLFTLTGLQYSDDHTGPWRLYLYDEDGFHSGAKWFAREIQYPDEERTIAEAKALTELAVASNLEVRVTDGGDMLVFHVRNGEILYGKNFWEEIENGKE